MKRIFISDLHLGPDRPDLTRAFRQFLDERCRDAHELYILGDFFETWLGDDDTSDLNRETAALLRSLACRVFIMHGNRDFLLGDAFCRSANARLLPDPSVVAAGGKPVLLMHGDSLCTLDTAYMEARRQLRSAAFRKDFLARPLAERAALARRLRGESRRHTRETAADIMDVTPREVVTVMQEAGVSTLIHGHTHRPAVHDFLLGDKPARRYVLGDWQTSMQYLAMTGGEMQLLGYSFDQACR